ncbi:MAG: hypothetical protein AAF318_01465 [Pseudomonadota bacterium]
MPTSAPHMAAEAERLAETMVLDGVRHFARGQATRSTAPWTAAQEIYRSALGDALGEAAIIALARFVKVMGRCATCPLRVYPAPSGQISRDEVLILGLISGIQNGDDVTSQFCLERLCCSTLCEEVASAASIFAFTLKASRQTLRPIPVSTLMRVVDGEAESAAPRTHH